MQTQSIRCQGRTLSATQLRNIQALIDEHPQWSRHRVGVELCRQWSWRTARGVLKTFAARALLLKLEARQGLRLPPVQEHQRRRPWGIGPALSPPGAPPQPVARSLAQIQPLRWELADYGRAERARALGYLRHYHYLGCERPVGSHLLYLVQDRWGGDLAVHLIGAAAWHCADRDRFIGWNETTRRAHLTHLANHSRFLVLPWMEVPHLASHLLGQLTRRLRTDWWARHGVPLVLLESFVEIGRFAGTAYRAANWQRVGQTTGRTRQEKEHRAQKPRKAIWLYPLCPEFRAALGVEAPGRAAR